MTSKPVADVALEAPGRPLRRIRLAVTEAGTLSVTGRLHPDEAAALQAQKDVLLAFVHAFPGATVTPEDAATIRAQRATVKEGGAA